MISSYPSLIAVASDENGEIYGHTAVLPHDIKIGGRVLKCGLGFHTIIDKDYRDKGLILPLLEMVDRLAEDYGLDFYYGFPNKYARPIYKLPNHYRVEKFLAIEKDSCPNIYFYSRKQFAFEQITTIDYDLLFSMNQILDLRKKEEIEFCRNLQYYCVRYFFHPQKLYRSFKIYNKDEFVGCLVTKKYEKEGKSYFHLVDLLVKDGTIDYESLMNDIVFSFSEECDIFSFWKVNEQIKEVLLKMGFTESGFDTFLGLRLLPNNRISEEEKQILLDFRNWRLVMGDSDAF